MRSIMYDGENEKFYVNCYGGNIYELYDMENGLYRVKYENLYSNEQAGLGFDPKGEMLYYLDRGTLWVYDLKTGELEDTYYDIRCGETSFDGGAVVAVGKKSIYTWSSLEQEIYVYNRKNMELKKSVRVKDGNYGFSLSCADKLVFVSEDGDYDLGTWYAYKIK